MTDMKERTEEISRQPDRDDLDIQHFTLAGILPQGHALAVHARLGIAAHLMYEEGAPRIQDMHHFGETEILFLLLLLQQYPHYCPCDLLLARYASGDRMDDRAIMRAREQLNEARQEGLFDNVMKPIRNVLSRVRPRLHALGLMVVSRREQGYQLLGAAAKRTALA